MSADTIRLQKYLAEQGVASRRACADIIRAGRVHVNGQPAEEPGHRLDPIEDRVTVDGKPFARKTVAHRTIVMYKPRGYICSTRASQGRTVFELLPALATRLVPVGRLDKDSEGLLLMSSDGDLVQQLTHPRHHQEKVYHVTVSGDVTASVLRRLGSRLVIDGYRIQPVSVRLVNCSSASSGARNTHVFRSREEERRSGTSLPRRSVRAKPGKRSGVDKASKCGPASRHMLEFILAEGRNRQIRKMCAIMGLRVHRLVRVRVRGIELADLTSGQWRELTADEVAALKT